MSNSIIKKIVFSLILLYVSPFYSQSENLTDQEILNDQTILSNINSSISNSIEKKAKHVDPHYINIFTIIGGVSTIGGGSPKNHTTPTSWFILEGRIPIPKQDFFIYLQFRTSYYMGQSFFPVSAILPIIHLESTKIGMALGFGGILKDWRSSNFHGWYLQAGGSLLFEGAVHNMFVPINTSPSLSPIYRYFNIGTEFSFFATYSHGKHKGINLGFHIAYLYHPYSGDAFYLGLARNIVFFHTLSYGISFGINF